MSERVITFEEWNNGEVHLKDEYYKPIYATRVIASTGEEFKSSQIIGYRGVKSGIRLGFWATCVLE